MKYIEDRGKPLKPARDKKRQQEADWQRKRRTYFADVRGFWLHRIRLN